jgi:(2Fe-2S) ferredoxin
MSPSRSRFELRGEFAGFVRNAEGKRRMLLRARGEEVSLKVPKELRRRLDGLLHPGHVLAVAGVEKRDPFDGTVKRVVSHARLLSAPAPPRPAACAACPIRICAKKNCWRSGGKQLWETLGRRVEELGLAGRVELKATGCLGKCKCAPNVVAGERHHGRCSTAEADAILARAVAVGSHEEEWAVSALDGRD